MNLESIRMKEWVLLLPKRPVVWVSLLAPPLLHIIGLGFVQILASSTALFFFTLSIPRSNPLLDSKLQDQDQDPGKQNGEDGTIPDEESYIELSLPSGNYIGHHYNTINGQPNHVINKKNHLLLSKTVRDFKLIHLLAEFEDDNLIEIDISAGSIKCSKLHIKA